MYSNEIRQRAIYLRVKKGLSSEAVAKELGINAASVRNWTDAAHKAKKREVEEAHKERERNRRR